MKIGNTVSRVLNVSKRFRQGCCVSPTLFKVYVKEFLLKWKRKYAGMGIPLENTRIFSLQFAYDKAVFAGDKDDLEYQYLGVIFDKTCTHYNEIRMRIIQDIKSKWNSLE